MRSGKVFTHGFRSGKNTSMRLLTLRGPPILQGELYWVHKKSYYTAITGWVGPPKLNEMMRELRFCVFKTQGRWAETNPGLLGRPKRGTPAWQKLNPKP